MTTVNIDIKNIASSTHPDDRVVFYSPANRNAEGTITSTATQEVPLVNGQATVDLVPGPVVVRLEALGVADTREKSGYVPEPVEGADPISLWDIILDWTPALVDQGILAILASLDDALGQVSGAVAAEVESIRWRYPAVPLETTSISELADGSHRVASTTVAQNLGLPPLLGHLQVRDIGVEIRTATFQTEGTITRPTELWITSSLRTTGEWLPWQKIPTSADIPTNTVTSSQLTTAVDGVRFRHGNVGLAVTSLSDLPDGQHGIASNTVSNNLGLPGGVLGTLTLRLIGVEIRTATFQTEGTASTPSALWVTSTVRTTGAWQPWKKLAVEGTVVTTSSAPVAPAGLKTVPLALTLGQGAKNAAASGSHRIPFRYVPEIARYRLGFSLRNTRSNLTQGAGVVVSAAIGTHASNGAFSAAPTTVMTDVAVPDDGSAVYSSWVGADIGSDVEHLLAYTYTSTAVPFAMVGGGWSAGTASITDLAPTTTKVLESPLNIWLEVEVESTVPVLGIIGDSITCGVGTSLPVYEAWGNVYARSIGGLAILWGMSGDTAAKWVESSTQYKVTRWDHMDPPDAMVWALGRNDFSNGSTAAAVKTMTETALGWMLQKSRRCYAAAITPRTSGLGDVERAAHNEWLRTRFHDVLPFDEVIGAEGGGIKPEFHADGLHPNTAGAAAMAASITRPMTAVRSAP